MSGSGAVAGMPGGPPACAMETGIGILVVLAGTLAVLARSVRVAAPAEHLAGLFRNPCDLGWPRGVQEDDAVRPWGPPPAPRHVAIGRELDAGHAVIEDLPGGPLPFAASAAGWICRVGRSPRALAR